MWRTVNNIAEAGRQTLAIQYRNVIIAVLHLLLVTVFYFAGLLSVNCVLFLIQVEILIVLGFSIKIIQSQIKDEHKWKGNFLKIYEKVKSYCKPLVLLTLVGGAVEFLDRWLLQKNWGLLFLNKVILSPPNRHYP